MSDGEASAQRPLRLGTIRAGTHIGRYIVIDRLGAGGLGVVLTAYDPKLDRRVALKLLRADARETEADSQGQRRLAREAQAMAKLQHANVVAVYDVGVHREAVYITMELVRGRTLGSWMREADTPRPWGEVLAVLTMAGRGLAAAHDAGLVHRDFKPDNVMLSREGLAKVMDFGLVRAVTDGHATERIVEEPGAVVEAAPADADADAKRAMDRVRERLASMGKLGGSGRASTDDTLDATVAAAPPQTDEDAPAIVATGEELTRTGAVMGTPAYMAPEQVAGQRVDARGDQFAFCVTLYEALYGVRPFVADTWTELARKILSAELGPAPHRDVPAWLHEVIARGLAKKPEDRWPDMHALLAALDRSQRRSRRAVGLAAIGVLSAVGVAGWAIRGQVDPCAEAGEDIDEVLSSTRRDAIVTAIGGVDVGYAEETATRVEAALSQVASAYRDAARATCSAHVEHEISDALFDRRRACLHAHREAAGAMASALEQPTAADVERASDALARLPPLAACEDDASLLAEVQLPTDGAARAAIGDARFSVARIEALATLGRFGAAVDAAESLRPTVETLGFGPLRAELAFARGRALELAGRSADAIEALTEAAHEGRASGDDRTAAAAETWLVFSVGARARQPERARWWAQSADAAVRRLPSHGSLAARLDWHLGTVEMLAGDSETGVRLLRAAASEMEAAVGPTHPDAIEAKYNLAVALRRVGEDERAMALQAEVLAARRERLGATHPEVGRTLGEIGVLAHKRGDRDEAIARLEEARDVLVGAVGDRHPLVASVLGDLAAVWGDAGRFEAAHAAVAKAREITVAALGDEHPKVALLDAVEGGLWRQEGDLVRAAEAYRRALTIDDKALGPDDPQTQRVRRLLDKVTTSDGDEATASP